MAVLSSIKAVGAFILVPIYQLLRALGNLLAGLILIIFAPVIHVAAYAGHAFFVIPYRIFAKFESIYIFLGVAAVVGILTGGILYLVSKLLVSVLGIGGSSDVTGRTAASVRAARRKRIAESRSPGKSGRFSAGSDLKREYAEWLEPDREKKGKGLLSQTILEEEDDNSDGDF
ncbi:MAG: hypothetical protein M1824_006203 [Vezdaea acicularis]|nr:MAG: hypothetical protein M1824_006203 [Vezdaea acicularis]